MSEMSLPASTQLHQSVPSLPKEISRLTNRIFPSNGSNFVANQSIQFDLGTVGSLVPESLQLHFTYQITTAGLATLNTNSFICGTPAYSCFRQLDTQCNGSMLQSIQNYNQVGHLLCKTRMGLAARCSAATSLGINASLCNPTQGAQFENLNAYAISITGGETTSLTCSQPVISILSTADKVLPLFAAGAIRMTFWTANLSDYVVLGTAQSITNLVITNVSLTYDTVNLGPQYEEMVKMQGPSFTRSTHYACISQNLAAVSGASNIDLVMQARLSSIRAVYVLPTFAGRNIFDTYSITTPGTAGRLWFNFNGINYPQSGIDLSSVASCYNELRVCAHSTGHSSDSFHMSIPALEYQQMSTVTPSGGLTLSPLRPASFFIGTSMEKMGSAGGFLVNGTSSQSAPIIVRYNTSAATLAYNVLLVAAADCILSFDPQARTITADV